VAGVVEEGEEVGEGVEEGVEQFLAHACGEQELALAAAACSPASMQQE
jgi:hypothetical protein